MKLFRKLSIFGVMAAAMAAHGQTWDLENDWATNTNPNGQWQYGQVNGGTFSQLPWDGGSYGVPGVQAFVYQNTTGSLAYGVQPGDVSIESDWGNAAVEWTAPTSGMYTVTITMGGTTQTAGGGYGNNFAQYAGVAVNGSNVAANSFSNNVMSFSFTDTLSADSTITAFVLNPGYANGGNTDTHFTVQSVPEPAPFAVMGLGALGLVIRRRVRK